MDWKKTFNKGQWLIHGIFLFALLASAGITIYSLRLNQYQEAEEANIKKLHQLIDGLKTDDAFSKMGKYLSWAQSDKAFEKMGQLSRQIAETENLLEIKADPELISNIRNFNKLISNNTAMSDPADALKVFTQKVSSLITFAEEKNYKNVQLTAQGMKRRLENLHSKNVGSSIQVSYLRSDLQKLQALVSRSSLTDAEKAALSRRFSSMQNELQLLSSLNSQSRDLSSHVNKASLALAQWMLEVEKKAENFQNLRYQKQNRLLIFLASLVGFLLTAWLGLAYLFRWQQVEIGRNVENEVKAVIEKGILADQRFMIDHYSENIRDDIVMLMDQLKVRLNLGSMLHEGLPFAGFMIDKSFKITWHNQIFLEQFYLSEEEVKSEAFHWDYLREYLNLKEDPVYQALVNKIGGIYAVKLKQDDYSPALPFEMYVSPIMANREDRVMVFFYPLVSVKDAIDEQVGLAKDSLTRFIELWNEEKLNDDEMVLLEKDFAGIDLEDTFSSLKATFERVTGDKEECILTIHELEKENSRLFKIIEDMEKLEVERKIIIKEELQLSNELRTCFINALGKSESLAQINKTVLQQNDELRTDIQRLQQVNSEAGRRLKETLDVIGQLEAMRIDYKNLKFELLEVKTRLISLNGTLHTHLPADESIQKVAMKFKDELSRLDTSVSSLEKKLGFLDVLITKLQMLNDQPGSEQILFNWATTQKDHALKEALLEIQKGLSIEETRIIENFNLMAELMKKELTKGNEATGLTREALENFLS